MMECPCRYCNEHAATCHATCTKGYKEYAKERQEKREREHEAKERHGLVLGHMKDVRKKQKDGAWKKDMGDRY